MSRELSIILKDHEVRDVLAGLKTQHRWEKTGNPRHGPMVAREVSVGDLLWVREAHYVEQHPSEWGVTREMIPKTWDLAVASAGTVYYRADSLSDVAIDGRRWTPSVHMPRWASRITLEVTRTWIEWNIDVRTRAIEFRVLKEQP